MVMKKTSPNPQVIPTESEIIETDPKDVKKYLSKLKIKRIAIVFFGSDSWSIHVLKALEDNFEVAAVITAPNSAVSSFFKGLVLTPDKLNEDLKSYLLNLQSDLFVVASYGKIIPQAILDIPKYGALNVHPSLLPKFRGPSPVPATILSGDKETGVTIIKMDAEMDHGSIVLTKEIKLSGQEDTPELINKLFQLGGELIVDVIPDFIAGKIDLKEQNHSQATFCKMMKREDGYFEIDNPPSPEVLDRMIRAYNPWPGVWTKWNLNGKDKIVKFLPGGLVQMEGKKILSFKDFLNGYPNFPLKDI
jgi:methionyl-tRNA formyltransferase